MALHLERDTQILIQRYHACVLKACALQRLAIPFKEAQYRARVFITAVFRPHHGEHAQFHIGRLASHQVRNALVLGVGQSHVAPHFGRTAESPHQDKVYLTQANKVPHGLANSVPKWQESCLCVTNSNV